MTNGQVSLTKVDAAKRQMTESIRLFFEGRDEVSVHTLASASAQVFYDLCKAQGKPTLLRGQEMIRDEKRKEWLKFVKGSENFFKHAEKDPDELHVLVPMMTHVTILETVQACFDLTGRFTYEGTIFLCWFGIQYPELLLEGPLKRHIETQSRAFQIHGSDLGVFRDMILFKERILERMPHVFG